VFVGAFIHYYFLKLVKMVMMGMGSMVETNGVWKLDRNLKLYNLKYIVTRSKA
jgi:hypothetical protein